MNGNDLPAGNDLVQAAASFSVAVLAYFRDSRPEAYAAFQSDCEAGRVALAVRVDGIASARPTAQLIALLATGERIVASVTLQRIATAPASHLAH